jgi:hypothetical protein
MKNTEMLPRELKTAGSVKPFRLVSLFSRCGDIRNGIAFRFKGESAFVVDAAELERIVEEAKAYAKH